MNHDEIQVDTVLKSADEGYESSAQASSTQSLTSSINAYIVENGRRYHVYYGQDKSLFPVDEAEKDRLDLHHEIIRLVSQESIYKAPLKKPNRILDVGTGTGIWAVDMACLFPECEVVGVDLSPIQPAFVPVNCRFEIDDVERDWTYATEHFDYIHARNIAQGISDWPKLMGEMRRCCKKGGYVELAEISCVLRSDDDTIRPDNGFKRFSELLCEAMIKINRPFPVSGDLKKYLMEAGFLDVQEFRMKVPVGLWPKDKKLKMAGAMTLLASETGFEAYGKVAFTRILGMSHEASEKAMRDALSGIKDPKMHAWSDLFVAYGRKPDS